MKRLFYLAFLLVVFWACKPNEMDVAPQWQEVELWFRLSISPQNPYTDVDFHVVFTNNGETIIRQAFWDGDDQWKVRFASPGADGVWNWRVEGEPDLLSSISPTQGRLKAIPYTGRDPLIGHGLLRMSEGRRNVVHADGTPFMLVADTPWALPWRADYRTAAEYARNRQERGFNSALLMTICPDREAEGPDARDTEGGYARAFDDIREGHINLIRPGYFQYLDSLVSILLHHGIVPVYQPVFHGYGWKGLNILGWDMDPGEYVRFCRYLVARYGARPAFWLISGDSDARNPGIAEGGAAVHQWDAYAQPTGLHYSPFDDFVPDWWDRAEDYLPHHNRIHQEKEWLDFQWCQTGHGGEHLYHKVERMYENLPLKAVANGEPTYEGIRDPANGAGWWQGEDAWMQLMSGGTMGVVYGAGGLWNWKITAEEAGWPGWANSNVSWREAIELEGSLYVGLVSRAFAELDFADMQKRWDLADGKPCLAAEGRLYICYLPEEEAVVRLENLTAGMEVQWFDPKTGEKIGDETTAGSDREFSAPRPGPMVLIVHAR